jgi:hypothetical protein
MFYNENNGTRKLVCSIVGGIVYAIGLWFLIDAGAYVRRIDTATQNLKFQWILPFIFGTLSILFVNCWTADDFRGNGLSEDNQKRARTCFLLGFVGLVLTLLFAVWLAIVHYFDKEGQGAYPGVGLVLANTGCVLSAFIVRFGHW